MDDFFQISILNRKICSKKLKMCAKKETAKPFSFDLYFKKRRRRERRGEYSIPIHSFNRESTTWYLYSTSTSSTVPGRYSTTFLNMVKLPLYYIANNYRGIQNLVRLGCSQTWYIFYEGVRVAMLARCIISAAFSSSLLLK